MDERTAERLLDVEAYQNNIIRLAADLERFDEPWIADHSGVPWRLIKGMRNRIAHNYWTVDDDVEWSVISQHAPGLHHFLADEIAAAHVLLEVPNRLDD